MPQDNAVEQGRDHLDFVTCLKHFLPTRTTLPSYVEQALKAVGFAVEVRHDVSAYMLCKVFCISCLTEAVPPETFSNDNLSTTTAAVILCCSQACSFEQAEELLQLNYLKTTKEVQL